jgi:hypothetical protein
MIRSLALLALLLPAAVLAQVPAPQAPRHFDIRRATGPIQIDGQLDEPAWGEALTFDVPYEWQPGDNVTPPVATDFLTAYDDHYLYAAWRAHDPRPGEIRAHLMDRDSIDTFVQDDHVVLMIDPFNDERRGFQFRINPLGVQADAVYSQQDGGEDWSFDMIWQSASRITADGYVVEVAIPLNQLRFPANRGPQTWGFDVGRSYPRSVRHRMSSVPRVRGDNCFLCQVVKVTGFEDLKPGRNLELTPTVTANRNDAAAFDDSGRPGSLDSGDSKVDAGLSARWGITPNLSLNAAINPDFSQVEADVAQLSVNERFALFFPEKRPFFLEGLDLFTTPLQAVFTRTVADPKWGVKLTGKQGRNAFGLFVAEDNVNNLTIPSNQQSLFAGQDRPVTSGVLRYRRDVGQGSSLGVLYTGRDGDGYHNRVGGLDGFARFSVADTLSVQYLRSDTLYPGEIVRAYAQLADAFKGDAFAARYQHNARDWFWQLAWEDRAPEFRADSGFIPRVDIREGRANLQRQFWGGQDDWYTQINVGISGRRTKDHSGQLTDERRSFYANVAGPLQSFFEVTAGRNTDFFRGRLYDGENVYSAYFTLQPSGAAKLTASADWGDAVDFTNNQPAESLVLSPSAELKLGRHANAQLSHTLQRLNVSGGELFEANLSQLRLIYNFNVRCFVRGIFQYLDLQRSPELYLPALRPGLDPETRTLFTQLLFSYKLNPQTVLFLGYSDDQLGTQDFSLAKTDRTLFFKVGYAWVM